MVTGDSSPSQNFNAKAAVEGSNHLTRDVKTQLFVRLRDVVG